MKPTVRKRLLLVAALVSLGSHWMLLKGIPSLSLQTAEPSAGSVMMTVVTPLAQADRPSMGVRKPPASGNAVTSPKPTVPADASPQQQAVENTLDPARADVDEREDEVRPTSATRQSPADEPETPQSGQLQFDVFLGDGEGDALAVMTHTLLFRDGQYTLSSRGEALGLLAMLYSGLLTQNSIGTWGEDGFSTLQYSEQRGKKPEQKGQVDPQRRTLSFSNGHSSPLGEGPVLDRLSVLYQLGLWLKDPAHLGKPAVYQVMSGSALERWTFVRAADAVLTIAERQVPSVHYRRQNPEGTEKTALDVWYAKHGDGLPIQIRLTDRKGTVITQRLSDWPGGVKR